MAVDGEMQSPKSWTMPPPSLPRLWENDTLQSLALFAVVSFGLIAYVLLVVKPQQQQQQQQRSKEKSA